MRNRQSSADVDALVAQLDAIGDAAAVARAHAFGVRTWFSWRHPGSGNGAAAKRTLVHVAAALGLVRALSRLIEIGGIDVINSQSSDDGATPMHAACVARPDALEDVLEVLIAHAADRDLRDCLGRRPLDILMAQVSFACLCLLLAACCC